MIVVNSILIICICIWLYVRLFFHIDNRFTLIKYFLLLNLERPGATQSFILLFLHLFLLMHFLLPNTFIFTLYRQIVYVLDPVRNPFGLYYLNLIIMSIFSVGGVDKFMLLTDEDTSLAIVIFYLEFCVKLNFYC